MCLARSEDPTDVNGLTLNRVFYTIVIKPDYTKPAQTYKIFPSPDSSLRQNPGRVQVYIFGRKVVESQKERDYLHEIDEPVGVFCDTVFRRQILQDGKDRNVSNQNFQGVPCAHSLPL